MDKIFNQSQQSENQPRLANEYTEVDNQGSNPFTNDSNINTAKNVKKLAIITLIALLLVAVVIAIFVMFSGAADEPDSTTGSSHNNENVSIDTNVVQTNSGFPVFLPTKDGSNFKVDSFIDGEYPSLTLVLNGDKPSQDNLYIFTQFKKTDVPSFVSIPKSCVEGIVQTSDSVAGCKHYYTTKNGFKVYHYYEHILDYGSGSTVIESINGQDYFLADHYLIDIGEYVISYESDKPADLDQLNETNLKPLLDSFDFANESNIDLIKNSGALISI